MARKIFQHLRGKKANLPKLSPGELIKTSDTEEIYIGGETANIRVLDQKDKTEISTQLADTVKEVNGVKPTNGKITLPIPEVDTSNLATKAEVQAVASGAPKAVSLVSQMTDRTKNYVYTGTESGYTAGNWYYWNGSAWVSGGVYQSRAIASNSVVPSMLDRTYAIGKIKSNMIDYTKLLENQYYDDTNGNLVAGNGSTFALPLIKLTSGKIYNLTIAGLFRYSFYDANGNFTSGGRPSDLTAIVPFTVDSSKVYIGLSYYNAQKNQAMFVEGNVLPTSYEPYSIVPDDLGKKTVSLEHLSEQVLGMLQGASSTVITVAKNGGNYRTIQAAINAAQDSVSKPVTIIIYPGIYNETVRLVDRYISLIGIDKKNTVILTETGDYSESPLDVGGGQIYIKNITCKATHDKPKGSYASTNRAYAVHADFGGAGTTTFENCDFISKQCAAAGIGTQPNKKIIFKDCNFEFSDVDTFTPAESRYGCIFAHSYSYATTEQQNVEFHNCQIYSSRYNAIRLSRIKSDFKCLFVNCFISGTNRNIALSDSWTDGTQTMPSIVINPDSFGNNIAQLNPVVI